MTQLARRLLLPIAIVQAATPALPFLLEGLNRIGGEAEAGLLRAPESPPGVFFAIWGVIFTGFLAFAIYAALSDTHLARRMAVPMSVTGLLGTLWMLMTQGMGETVWAYPVLLALAASAWWSAHRFDEMRGLGWGGPTFAADLTTGLYAGWMTLATAISTTTTVRVATGLGPTDQVWPMLTLALLIAVTGALVAFAKVTRSPWYMVALSWGLLGVIINTWSITGMTVGAVLTGVVALWLLRRRIRLGATGAAV